MREPAWWAPQRPQPVDSGPRQIEFPPQNDRASSQIPATTARTAPESNVVKRTGIARARAGVVCALAATAGRFRSPATQLPATVTSGPDTTPTTESHGIPESSAHILKVFRGRIDLLLNSLDPVVGYRVYPLDMRWVTRLRRRTLGTSAVAADESCQTSYAPRTNRLLKLGLVGTVITALCCFTPVLVVLFGVLGLAGIVGYLDYVLFPLLGVFLLLVVVGAVRFSSRSTSATKTKKKEGPHEIQE